MTERSGDFAYCWNGMRADGTPISIDPYKFVAFAMLLHPDEYLDETTGALKTTHIELSAKDAEMVGDPTLDGAVLVTIDPPKVDSYVVSARQAMVACRDAGNEALAVKYENLASKFEDARFQ